MVENGQGQEHIIEMVYNQDKDILMEADCNCPAYHSALADQVLGGESLSGGSFSKEELLELL